MTGKGTDVYAWSNDGTALRKPESLEREHAEHVLHWLNTRTGTTNPNSAQVSDNDLASAESVATVSMVPETLLQDMLNALRAAYAEVDVMSHVVHNMLLPLDGVPPPQHCRPIECRQQDLTPSVILRHRRLCFATKQSARTLLFLVSFLTQTLKSVAANLMAHALKLRKRLDADSNFFGVDAIRLRRLGWTFGIHQLSPQQRHLVVQFHPESMAYRAIVQRSRGEDGLQVLLDRPFQESQHLVLSLRCTRTDKQLWQGEIGTFEGMPVHDLMDLETADRERILAVHRRLLQAKATAENLIRYQKFEKNAIQDGLSTKIVGRRIHVGLVGDKTLCVELKNINAAAISAVDEMVLDEPMHGETRELLDWTLIHGREMTLGELKNLTELCLNLSLFRSWTASLQTALAGLQPTVAFSNHFGVETQESIELTFAALQSTMKITLGLDGYGLSTGKATLPTVFSTLHSLKAAIAHHVSLVLIDRFNLTNRFAQISIEWDENALLVLSNHNGSVEKLPLSHQQILPHLSQPSR